ncbi:MAG: hypothetical protein IT371_02150 [Deltaproteobacteria bacterium]|nr:hypothetical protein [Deltaproteobacteria bacterium]
MNERLAHLRDGGLVAAAAIASHLFALRNGFVWLDHGDLEAGAALAPPAAWLDLFARGYARTGFYRPLTALTLSLDSLWGSPVAYHATSLALHALCAVAVVAAARSLGAARSGALAAGLLFAVHPVTSLVANQIVYRGDSLATAALLGVVWAHRTRRPLLAGVAMLAGGLSKETALVLGPLVIAALEWTQRTVKGRWALWLSEGAALAAALALRWVFAPAWRAFAPPLSPGDAVGTRLAALWKSALALAAPVDFRFCDAFPVTGLASAPALLGLAVALGLLGVGCWKRGPALLFALALLPSLQLVPAPRFWSPHYLYLPLAFGAMVLGRVAERHRRPASVILAVALTVLGGASLVESRRYRSDETLFAPELAGRPECREAALYVGDARRSAGDLAGAAKAYEAAAAKTPGILSYSDEAAALQNLGLVRLAQNRPVEAELAFVEALERRPPEASRRELVHNLAAVAVTRGDPDGAIRLLTPEVARADVAHETVLLLARALRATGRNDAASALLAAHPFRKP